MNDGKTRGNVASPDVNQKKKRRERFKKKKEKRGPKIDQDDGMWAITTRLSDVLRQFAMRIVAWKKAQSRVVIEFLSLIQPWRSGRACIRGIWFKPLQVDESKSAE